MKHASVRLIAGVAGALALVASLVVAAASLVFEPILGAVLAGILSGMGIVSLVSCIEVALWERRTDTQVFADADVHTRRYVTPPSAA